MPENETEISPVLHKTDQNLGICRINGTAIIAILLMWCTLHFFFNSSGKKDLDFEVLTLHYFRFTWKEDDLHNMVSAKGNIEFVHCNPPSFGLAWRPMCLLKMLIAYFLIHLAIQKMPCILCCGFFWPSFLYFLEDSIKNHNCLHPFLFCTFWTIFFHTIFIWYLLCWNLSSTLLRVQQHTFYYHNSFFPPFDCKKENMSWGFYGPSAAELINFQLCCITGGNVARSLWWC